MFFRMFVSCFPPALGRLCTRTRVLGAKRRECQANPSLLTRSRTALQGSAVAAAVAAVPFSVPVAAVVAAEAVVVLPVCLCHRGPSSSRGSVA